MNGHLLRCQQLLGHFSAHYCDHYWWANDKGLPMRSQRVERVSFWRRLFMR